MEILKGNTLVSNENSGKSISIFGSCVSRDILAYTKSKAFVLDVYIARQSIVSAVSPKIEALEIKIQIDSPFRQQAVAQDLRKETFTLLSSKKSDYLMIDLIDERFPLLRFFESYITASNEFFEGTEEQYQHNKKLKKRLKKRLMRSDLYLEEKRIEGQILEFCERIKQIYPPNQIILHKAKMTNGYEDKDGKIQKFPPHQLKHNRTFNAILDAMYQRLERYLPGAAVIDEMEGALASEQHKWGLAPMHYHDAYYVRVLAKLLKIAEIE